MWSLVAILRLQTLVLCHIHWIALMGQHLEFLHDIGVAGVLKQHVVQLLDWLDLLPLALGDQLLVDLVVGEEEVVESLVAIGDVPGDSAARLHYTDQLGEGLKGGNWRRRTRRRRD